MIIGQCDRYYCPVCCYRGVPALHALQMEKGGILYVKSDGQLDIDYREQAKEDYLSAPAHLGQLSQYIKSPEGTVQLHSHRPRKSPKAPRKKRSQKTNKKRKHSDMKESDDASNENVAMAMPDYHATFDSLLSQVATAELPSIAESVQSSELDKLSF